MTPRPDTPITLAPIGFVESPFADVTHGCDYATASRIVVDAAFERGLAGVEYFSHLCVIYHQHRAAAWLGARGWVSEGPLALPADDDRAGQGVFSSRAPCRPARLGSCIVGLVRREGCVLTVTGLDAIHGTPVLDLKPYVPRFDAFPDASIPAHWARVLEREDEAARVSRTMHWDTTAADFALGLRAGAAALGALGCTRGSALRADYVGNPFFAQGVECATGCSPLRGTLAGGPPPTPASPGTLRVTFAGTGIALTFRRGLPSDAAAILRAEDAALWSTTAFQP